VAGLFEGAPVNEVVAAENAAGLGV
jgi:hypothetical protein